MRRSEWHRRADDPKGLLGWWWRGVSEGGWPFYLLGGSAFGLALAIGNVWIGAVAMIASFVGQGVRAVRFTDRLKPMLPEPAPEGQFRATVTYRREGLVLGRDSMAFSAVDGWLYAEGVRSHFALCANDVLMLVYQGGVARSVMTLTDGTQVEVDGDGALTHRALVDWRHDLERPQGKSTFPPAKTHVEQIARWLVWSFAGAALVFSTMVANSLPSLVARHESVYLLLALVGGSAFLLGSSRLSRLVAISNKARREESLTKPIPPLQADRLAEAAETRVTAKRL